MSRETIRQMLQDCFQFLTFDENPRLLFDPDSKFEFSPRGPIPEPNRREDPSVEPEPAPDDPPIRSEAPQMEDRIKLSSTVAAIHAELTSCRKRTVDVFGQMCEQLEQLERHRKDSRGHDTLRKAEMLRRVRVGKLSHLQLLRFRPVDGACHAAGHRGRGGDDQGDCGKWRPAATPRGFPACRHLLFLKPLDTAQIAVNDSVQVARLWVAVIRFVCGDRNWRTSENEGICEPRSPRDTVHAAAARFALPDHCNARCLHPDHAASVTNRSRSVGRLRSFLPGSR